MPHFLIKKENISDNFITLNQDDESFFHIVKVLRIKIGQNIKFIDKDKNIYNCIVEKLTKTELTANVINKEKSLRYLKNDICLVQSVLLGDSQNELIANATQAGIKEIFPVVSDNVSVKNSTLNNKTSKWFKVMLENFKQCERADLVYIHEVFELKEVLKQFKKENILIFAEKFDNATLNNSLNDIDKTEKIAIVIGPEGGFSDNEFEYFKNQNYKLITLGKMIYKAPNAAVVAISNVVTRLEI